MTKPLHRHHPTVPKTAPLAPPPDFDVLALDGMHCQIIINRDVTAFCDRFDYETDESYQTLLYDFNNDGKLDGALQFFYKDKPTTSPSQVHVYPLNPTYAPALTQKLQEIQKNPNINGHFTAIRLPTQTPVVHKTAPYNQLTAQTRLDHFLDAADGIMRDITTSLEKGWVHFYPEDPVTQLAADDREKCRLGLIYRASYYSAPRSQGEFIDNAHDENVTAISINLSGDYYHISGGFGFEELKQHWFDHFAELFENYRNLPPCESSELDHD